MRFSPIVLMLFAMLGCGSGSQSAKPSAESGDSKVQEQKVATPEKQAATPAEKAPVAKTPDAATVKKAMTPDQLALGDPIVNGVGIPCLIYSQPQSMGTRYEHREWERETSHVTKSQYKM